MERLPLEIQTLYAELMERLTAFEAARSIGSLNGSFVSKTVKGVRYVYFQHSQPGGRTRQIYLGRHSNALEKLMGLFHEKRDEMSRDLEGIFRLCALLRAGGAQMTDAPSARVLKSLSEAAVFHLDGVLVGTHAFTVLGNLLGVRWKGAALRTQDIDIAGEAGMAIAVPDMTSDIPRALDGLQMGFLPVPPFDPKQPSTSFKVRGKALRVDLLTPAKGPSSHPTPVRVPRFRAAARPLPFLDYILDGPVKGAVINGGGTLVNVPSPARFAFHKLIIAQERHMAARTKAEKDLIQAASIFEVLLEDRPGDIGLAWEVLKTRGERWTKRVRRSMDRLEKKFPDVVSMLKNRIKMK